MVDLAIARENAKAKKAEAKAKAEAAKREARDKKASRAIKLPIYVNMPEQTGDAEVDSAADLDAVQAGFRARAKDDQSRKALATDTEYWACLCFQTRSQKEAFLKALGLIDLGDKYINGVDAAEILGIRIPDERPPYHDVSKVDKTWAAFVK